MSICQPYSEKTHFQSYFCNILGICMQTQNKFYTEQEHRISFKTVCLDINHIVTDWIYWIYCTTFFCICNFFFHNIILIIFLRNNLIWFDLMRNTFFQVLWIDLSVDKICYLSLFTHFSWHGTIFLAIFRHSILLLVPIQIKLKNFTLTKDWEKFSFPSKYNELKRNMIDIKKFKQFPNWKVEAWSSQRKNWWWWWRW